MLHSHRNTSGILRANAEGDWTMFRSSTPAHMVPLHSTYLCKSMALTRAALGTRFDAGSGDPVQQTAGLFQAQATPSSKLADRVYFRLYAFRNKQQRFVLLLRASFK
jgi:hypothetical protein